MFGFPFFTSLIVALSGVVVFSLFVNKGLAERPQEKGATLNTANEVQSGL